MERGNDFMGKITPLVSVCVPMYGTENLLEKCLASIAAQKPVTIASKTSHSEKNISLAEKIVPPFEIVIVNDGSNGKDEHGRSGEKIIKDFEKSIGKKRGLFSSKKNAEELPPAADKITRIEYIEHGKNRGLVEARRTLVEAAEGAYICMLDSDDTLPENALAILYDAAVTSQADIVHGKANVMGCDTLETAEEEMKVKVEKRVSAMTQKMNNVHEGFLHGKEILRGYIIDANHEGMLWGKLITRELYLEALSHIPNVFCTMSEDILQYFWIAFEAESYFGFSEAVYNYVVGTGITSDVVISDLKRWEQVCSASSVFTAIFTEIENLPPIDFSDAEKSALNNFYNFHIYDNLNQLKLAVDDSIKSRAYEILCDFWGKENVELVRKASGLELSV